MLPVLIAHLEGAADAVRSHVVGQFFTAENLLRQDEAVLHVEVAFRERAFRGGLCGTTVHRHVVGLVFAKAEKQLCSLWFVVRIVAVADGDAD